MALVALVALHGCGGGERQLDHVVVHGRVSYDGQPVAAGDIHFTPIGDTSGPTTGAKIENGKFRADHRGGVPAGRHRVRISGYIGDPPPPTTPDGPVAVSSTRNYVEIPARYDQAPQIEITIDAGADEISRDFDLSAE